MDDYVLALYQRDGYWGDVAKSNYIGLRFREVIYRNLCELMLSYFEDYYNINKSSLPSRIHPQPEF